MRVLWTARSTNRKLGDVPQAWVGGTVAEARGSCAGCAQLPYHSFDMLGSREGGCYAWRGTVGVAFRHISSGVARAPRGSGAGTLRQALAERSPDARIVRLSALGDIGRCSVDVRDDIVRQVRQAGLQLVGYTHHWREPRVFDTWLGLLLASCDTLDEADEAAARGWRVAVILPSDWPLPWFRTPHGRRGVVCPAQLRTGVTCNTCPREGDDGPHPKGALCGADSRSLPEIIGFLAHGPGARHAHKEPQVDQLTLPYSQDS